MSDMEKRIRAALDGVHIESGRRDEHESVVQSMLQAACAQGGEPFAWCFTDVNGKPSEFCDNPKHASEGDLRIRTPLYTHSQPAQQGVPEWMAEISSNLKTQDNRITADPLFVVFQKREIVVDQDFDYDRISWGSCEGEAPAYIQEQLDGLYDDTGSDHWRESSIEFTDEDTGTEIYNRCALKEVDEFVTACFTEVGAKAYLQSNGHNLRQPFIYVTSLYRNEEMKQLRDWLLATTPQPADGWKLVPVEPTGDMEEAGCQGYMGADGNWAMHRSSMGHAYQAMLEAAPQPPEQGADDHE